MVSNLDQLRRSWYVLAFQVPGIPEWLIQQNLREFVKRLFQEQAVRKGFFPQKTLKFIKLLYQNQVFCLLRLTITARCFLPGTG